MRFNAALEFLFQGRLREAFPYGPGSHEHEIPPFVTFTVNGREYIYRSMLANRLLQWRSHSWVGPPDPRIIIGPEVGS